MNPQTLYSIIKFGFLFIGAVIFAALFFITAPYGRYSRGGWGPEINNRLGWTVMEAVSPIGFVLLFLVGNWKSGPLPYVFLGLWLFHYIYRSFIFPGLMPSRNNMPVSVVLFAVLFNGFNSYLQGGYLYIFSPGSEKYGISWLGTPQFLIGGALFFIGFVIHARSDYILRNLRQPGETGYKIPTGWFFRWISAPNYFGEMVEWIGWAVLTWSLPGLVFALWTIFNLLPRAVSHHKWYRETFDEYPEDRKAIIPGLF